MPRNAAVGAYCNTPLHIRIFLTIFFYQSFLKNFAKLFLSDIMNLKSFNFF